MWQWLNKKIGTVSSEFHCVALVLTKAQVRPKSGVQYFGIQVSNLTDAKNCLQAGGVALSENANGQIQLNDPEGNRVVVSEHAWN